MKTFNASKATDSELLVRFEQVRDQSAFAEIVRRHGPMVMATASRRLDNLEDARDAFQATFLALAKSVDRLQKKDQVAAWLHCTARKTASSIRRGLSRQEKRVNEFVQIAMQEDSRKEPLDFLTDDENLRILDHEVDRLPTEFRTVVVLVHLEGLSQRQVAQRLGIHVNTVRERLSKARKILQKNLVSRGVTVAVGALAAGIASRSKNATAETTSTLIAETTTMAIRFAAGQSAEEIGANINVLNAANGIITSMAMHKFVTACLMALAFALVGYGATEVASKAMAQPLRFYDDFSDGNLTDGDPGTWVPGDNPSGSRTGDGGRFVATSDEEMSTVVSELDGLVDVTIETQFKFDKVSGNGDAFGVFARAVGTPKTRSYVAGLNSDGLAYLVYEDENDNRDVLAFTGTSLDPALTAC